MRVAVVDLSQGDDTTGHPVVNVIVADTANDTAPESCILLEDTIGVNTAWLWSAGRGFIAPDPVPE